MTDPRLERVAEVIYDEYRVGRMPDYQPMWHELDEKPGPMLRAARRILAIADEGRDQEIVDFGVVPRPTDRDAAPTREPDEAIHALAKGVAQATIERVAEIIHDDETDVGEVYATRHALAQEMADITLACADEDPTSEVHALRAPTREGAGAGTEEADWDPDAAWDALTEDMRVIQDESKTLYALAVGMWALDRGHVDGLWEKCSTDVRGHYGHVAREKLARLRATPSPEVVEALNEIEAWVGLHEGLELTYAVDGYEVDLTKYDGATTAATGRGESIAEAFVDLYRALSQLGGTER